MKDMLGRVIDIVAPHRQGPARPDRRAAAHRQDGACCRTSPTRSPPTIPKCYLIVLLIDERPEEVTDMQRIGEGRGHLLDLRRAGHAPRPGRRDGDREGQAPGRAQARRRHPARFDHPPRPRLQHRGAVLRQGADRRRRRQRAAAAEALLRRRAQHRGRRLADHHRHRADRYRQPHGRSDLRRVQGHRQLAKSSWTARSPTSASSRRSTSRKSGTRKEELLVEHGDAVRRCRCCAASSTRWARSTRSSSCSTS